jgi:hypothetical protein
MALISHLHSDHFDPVAQNLLPKDVTILCQPEDKSEIESKGFRDVIPVTDMVSWKGITITRTPCQHGTGQVLQEMGNTSGFVFQAENEPTVYWAGDTIWCEAVASVISRTRPDVIITHSCGAMLGDQKGPPPNLITAKPRAISRYGVTGMSRVMNHLFFAFPWAHNQKNARSCPQTSTRRAAGSSARLDAKRKAASGSDRGHSRLSTPL